MGDSLPTATPPALLYVLDTAHYRHSMKGLGSHRGTLIYVLVTSVAITLSHFLARLTPVLLFYCCEETAYQGNSYKTRYLWSGEMAQQVKTLTVLSEDPGSNPSNHMTAHNCLNS